MQKEMEPPADRTPTLKRWLLDFLGDAPPRVVDPPILHHYTDANGVYGILTRNCLWASAAQFSNDKSEIDYSIKLAVEIIEELWGTKNHLSKWEQILLQHLREILDTPLHTFGQPFMISFCEDGDLLSQWRGYGREGGFSLAFSPICTDQTLDRLLCEEGFRTVVRKVMYKPDEQRNRLRFILERLRTLVNSIPFPPDSKEGGAAHLELSLILVLEITDWVCTVKHRAFEEEREWRIITFPNDQRLVGVGPPNYKGVLVRPTSRVLLPYMVLKPKPPYKTLPLVEIRCGPGQFQEQSGRALEILLHKHGFENVAVTSSRVPVRI